MEIANDKLILKLNRIMYRVNSSLQNIASYIIKVLNLMITYYINNLVILLYFHNLVVYKFLFNPVN